MPVSPELLEILVCPETKQPVRVADDALLGDLNAKIDAGSLRNRGGESLGSPISEALVREDGRMVFIVEDSIPVMLIEEAIELS